MVKLIKADLRKDRAILIVFLLIIILSSLLLHTGLLVSDYRALYDRHAEQTALADYVVYADSDGEAIGEMLEGKNYVERYAVSDIISLPSLKFTTSKDPEEKNGKDWMLQSTADDTGMKDLLFLERDDSVAGYKIYLNMYTAYRNRLCIGDSFCMESDFGSYIFTVAGIYQHQFMGNSYSYASAMTEPEVFDEMKAARDAAIPPGSDVAWRKIVYVHLRDGYDPQECLNDTTETLVSEHYTLCQGITANEMRDTAYTAVVNILAAFMAAFAVIIMVICIIIIIFTINNNISRDVTNIGALKAVGFTVQQIRGALTAEFLLLGMTGAGIGIGLSYVLYPVLEYMYIREISGLVWVKRFFPLPSFGVLLGVAAVILAAAFFSTVRIRSLHPATALRFGLQANSFKKNHLPLSETDGELNLLLALKSALQNKAQNIIIFCIILSVSFVTMFSCVLYYNTRVDISCFQRMVQGDVPDGYFYPRNTSSEAVGETIEKLRTIDGISAVYGLGALYVQVEDEKPYLIYVTDPDVLNCGMYEGEMLREENETVLGITLAEHIGAGVGDEIEVQYGDQKMRFLVTGLQQSVLNDRLYVHENAAKKLGIPVNYSDIRMRVDDPDNDKVDVLLQKGRDLCGSEILNTENNFRFQHSADNVPVYAVGLIVVILVVLNVATVLLVITLLLKTVFVKREKEFGIKKAVGFTSSQLRYQLSLSLLPTTLLASMTGAVLGYFGINPMFALVLNGYGIKNSDLIIKAALMLLPVAAVTALVFACSYLLSGRMKKLSAYKLIQE